MTTLSFANLAGRSGSHFGLTRLVPSQFFRSLQIIWRSGASWLATDLQMSCNDLKLRNGTRSVILRWLPVRHAIYGQVEDANPRAVLTELIIASNINRTNAALSSNLGTVTTVSSHDQAVPITHGTVHAKWDVALQCITNNTVGLASWLLTMMMTCKILATVSRQQWMEADQLFQNLGIEKPEMIHIFLILSVSVP